MFLEILFWLSGCDCRVVNLLDFKSNDLFSHWFESCSGHSFLIFNTNIPGSLCERTYCDVPVLKASDLYFMEYSDTGSILLTSFHFYSSIGMSILFTFNIYTNSCSSVIAECLKRLIWFILGLSFTDSNPVRCDLFFLLFFNTNFALIFVFTNWLWWLSSSGVRL